MLRQLYLKFKNLPFVGSYFVAVRNFIFDKYVNKTLLDKKDRKKVQDILIDVFQDEEKVQSVMKEADDAVFMKGEFSYGQSCNYQVLFLYGYVRLAKPDTVVETGVASGRSSTAILEAMNKNEKGKLHSIDLFQKYEGDKPETYVTSEGNQENTAFIPDGKMPGWLVPDEYRDRWNLIIGDVKDKLPQLMKDLGEVDCFYHDSEHSYENMSFEFNTAWPKIKKGGLLVCDDYKWNQAFNDFITQHASGSKVYTYRSFGVVGR